MGVAECAVEGVDTRVKAVCVKAAALQEEEFGGVKWCATYLRSLCTQKGVGHKLGSFQM